MDSSNSIGVSTTSGKNKRGQQLQDNSSASEQESTRAQHHRKHHTQAQNKMILATVPRFLKMTRKGGTKVKLVPQGPRAALAGWARELFQDWVSWDS